MEREDMARRIVDIEDREVDERKRRRGITDRLDTLEKKFTDLLMTQTAQKLSIYGLAKRFPDYGRDDIITINKEHYDRIQPKPDQPEKPLCARTLEACGRKVAYVNNMWTTHEMDGIRVKNIELIPTEPTIDFAINKLEEYCGKSSNDDYVLECQIEYLYSGYYVCFRNRAIKGETFDRIHSLNWTQWASKELLPIVICEAICDHWRHNEGN